MSARTSRSAAPRVPQRSVSQSVGLPDLGLGWRVLLALGGGAAVGLSWQPYGIWPLLLVGLPAFTLAATRTRPRRAFWLAGLFAIVMLTLGIGWIRVLGGPIAVALIVFEALFFAVLGIAVTLVTRLPGWPVWVASTWVLVEFCYSRVPFGGFGWTRIGYAAVDTPLAGYLPFVGVAGVTFLVALIPNLVLWVLVRRRRAIAVTGLVAVGAIVLAGVAGTFFQVEPAQTGGTVNVGVVQGNVPGRGIEALGRARSVTYNHLSESVDLMSRARLGQVAMPDFLLWPENSTDIDPTTDTATGDTVAAAVRLADRPILVGAVTEGPGPDQRQTTSMWWDPKTGIVARYHKRNLVPFGEWIPFRDALLPLVPMLALVGPQSVPGTVPGALPVRLADGRPLTVGVVICFELAYDKTIADAVRSGAQVLTVQSNNATYGGTGQIEQQFAITRARAMETRREIAVATTNSVSGYIDRSGRVVMRTDEFTAASAVFTMPVRTALTPAMTLGPWVDRLLAIVGVLAILAALIIGLVVWRRAPRDDEDDDDDEDAGPAADDATDTAAVRDTGAADRPDEPPDDRRGSDP